MRLLRGIVLGLGGLEAVLILVCIALLLSDNQDPLGANIGQAVAVVLAIPLALCVLPALILGWRGRWLWFALALEAGWPLVLLVLSHINR